ncbi:ASCH domain-containing protein (plasmid) [Paraburkholderia sp. D15]|uniref:ASCH domain-containing protein n=1 Tax=Paraburkholderia sp. D15 TaxID=2880218 RepID=UPI0024797F0E|nr:ASCH domain-containing protein [Paraburkholderia sp. D15]WGS55070.1 ASCH domain-containing protein [Paraburkholderia sp. D15]
MTGDKEQSGARTVATRDRGGPYVLTLRLKRVYFEDISCGNKPWEYRLATGYWRKRIEGRHFDYVLLTLGYPARSEQDLHMLKPWRGYIEQQLLHPHFGDDEVHVFAVNVTAPTLPLHVLYNDLTRA